MIEPYPPGRVIDWKPGQPRKGVVDFGHKEGDEYRRQFEKYKNREITLEELKKFQREAEHFRLELPSENRGHGHEKKGK